MIFRSIRWRLQAWHGLILIFVLGGFGLTAYQVARENQFRRIDQDLNRHLMALLAPGRPEPLNPNPLLRPQPPGRPREPFQPQPPGEPPVQPLGQRPRPPLDDPRMDRRPAGPDFLRRVREAVQQGGSLDATQTNTFYYVLWQQDGSVLARSPGAPADVPPPERPERPTPQPVPAPEAFGSPAPSEPGPPVPPLVRSRGQVREMFRFLPRGQCVLVGRSVAPDLAALRRLALWLTAAGATVLLLGLAGGWWVATRAIRPIEDISATAVKIAGGDLAQRINAADTDNELGRLAGVLNSTFARLEAAFAQQARFTSDASHELRTPVSVILSQTQTALSRDRSSPEYREALEACQRAARRMRSLTESLLQLARLDAGQEPLPRAPFDLSRLARDCVELVRPLAAERRIQIHCDAPPLECLGDAERISQVITNLLTNAIHFNRDDGEIRVSVTAHGSNALLRVADTGQGIPAEDLPHLFERFYRADKSRSRTQGRNGLGLAICKAILDVHGGAIQVSSQPGTGTTVTVTLPLS
jgi:two-component system OmpR family sensor kinase